LKAARLDNSTEAEHRRLAAVNLLIIDDFALQPLDETATTDFYELTVARHRHNATIVTSNRTPDEWLGLMHDQLLAQSAVDRPPPATSSSSKATPTASASAPARVPGIDPGEQRNGQWQTVTSLSRTPGGNPWPAGAAERGERLPGTVPVPWRGWSAGARDRDQPVSIPAQGRGQLAACRLGNPARKFAAVRGQVGGAADIPGRTAQQRRREQDSCRLAGLPRRGARGDLPEPGQRLRIGGDDIPEMGGRLVRRPHLHRLGQGRDGDPYQGQR